MKEIARFRRLLALTTHRGHSRSPFSTALLLEEFFYTPKKTMANRKRGEVPYNPRKEQIPSCNRLDEFVRAPITGDPTEVPGISNVAVGELAEGDEPVTNTLQLFGKFLALSPDTPDRVEHCNRFKYWLRDKKINNGVLNTIVEAIAEKTETMFHGIYNAEAFGKPETNGG